MVRRRRCRAHGWRTFIKVVDTAAMFDDAVLGLFVVVGLAAWELYLLIKGPKKAVSRILAK